MRLTVIEVKANTSAVPFSGGEVPLTVDVTAVCGPTTLVYQSPIADAPQVGDTILISPIKEKP